MVHLFTFIFSHWFTEHFSDAIVTMETTFPASDSATKRQRLLQAAPYRSGGYLSLLKFSRK